MAQKVELRKRSGNSFSGDNNLMLPVTHVNYVLGLLDGNEKLNTSLLPDSMLSTKRMAGTINTNTNFSDLYAEIKTFNNSKENMYPGTYFISNGKRTISSSEEHVIQYNDDGLPAATSVDLENGDHLFYVKSGSSYSWSETLSNVSISSGDGGIAELPAPYNLIKGEHVFANQYILEKSIPPDSGIHALLTGYTWESATVGRYNNADRKVDRTANLGREAVVADINYIEIPGYDLWASVPDPGDGQEQSIVLKLEDSGVGTSYWELLKYGIGEEYETQDARVYESLPVSDRHIWGVVNNSYNVATTTSIGLMSASDKTKLNSLSNYEHPSYEPQELEATGIEVIDTIFSDASGHVIQVSTRDLPEATTTKSGIMSVADKTKLNSLANYSHPAYIARSIDTSGVDVVDTFTSDASGHVTAISTRTLPNASTTAVGVVQLAATDDAKTATDGNKVLTPASGLAMLNYNQDVSYFSNLTTANGANLPNGAIAIITTGSITIP